MQKQKTNIWMKTAIIDIENYKNTKNRFNAHNFKGLYTIHKNKPLKATFI